MATPLSTDKLYDLCVETEKNLERIATELGKLGADDGAVKAFTNMAEVVRRVCQGLAKNMQQEEPPAEAEEAAPEGQPRTIDEAANRMMARREAAAQQ